MSGEYSFTSADEQVQHHTTHVMDTFNALWNSRGPGGVKRPSLTMANSLLKEKDLAEALDFGARGVSRDTLLMLAAIAGLDDAVTKIVAAGADVNAYNDYHSTALMYAVQECTPELVRLLIEEGADVEARESGTNGSALWALANNLREEMSTLLMTCGASVRGTSGMKERPESLRAGPGFPQLQEHKNRWEPRLEAFRAGHYSPASREDWNCLASVMRLADPWNPPSIEARLQMLRDMRPDLELNLGSLRQDAMRTHTRAEGI